MGSEVFVITVVALLSPFVIAASILIVWAVVRCKHDWEQITAERRTEFSDYGNQIGETHIYAHQCRKCKKIKTEYVDLGKVLH